MLGAENFKMETKGFQKRANGNQTQAKSAQKGAQRKKKKAKMKPEGTKRMSKNLKGAKSEPKDAKRKRQGDQNGFKNRLGRQGRFWKQKGCVARQFLGAFLDNFSTKKSTTNRCKTVINKNMKIIENCFQKGAEIDAQTH